jgi:hydrogenase maturation protease
LRESLPPPDAPGGTARGAPDRAAPGEPGGSAAGEPGGSAAGEPGGSAAGVLVIGYGNALRSDDGIGVHAAALLREDPRLAGVEILALHQLTPELALDMSRASLVVLIDASTEGPPGSVAVRPMAFGTAAVGPGTAAVGPGTSSHHVGPGELVALAAELYRAAPEVIVVGIGVATVEIGEELSPAVAAALPAVAEAVSDLVAAHRGSTGRPA